MIAIQVREHIIRPVLKDIGLYSEDAEEQLIFTSAQESHLGKYIHQLGSGPACGMYQMEPSTHDDVWGNVLNYRPKLAEKVNKWGLPGAFPYKNAYQMCGNAYYATAMARCQYYRFSEALPNKNDIEGMASYWQRYWCRGCDGTIEEAISNYKRFAHE